MIPPGAAVELAAAALTRLNRNDRRRVDGGVPTTIASGSALDNASVAAIQGFWAEPPQPDDKAWRLAAALLGGEPLRRLLTAAAGPATTGLTTAVVDTFTAERLWTPGAHVVLLTHGDIAALDELHRIEAQAIAAGVAAQWTEVPVEFTHAVYVNDTLTVEGYCPELHTLRRELADACNRGGVPVDDSEPFRPHVVLAAGVDPLPEGPLAAPVTAQITALDVQWGGVNKTNPMNVAAGAHTGRVSDGGAQPAVNTTETTAAASTTPYPALNTALAQLQDQLRRLDLIAAAEVATAIQIGYASALDRVGRMATRADATLKTMSPAQATITADPVPLPETEIRRLIDPAIRDAAVTVATSLNAAHHRAVALIGDAFAVDLDPEDWTPPAISLLTATLRDEVLFRAGVTDRANIDPAEDTGDPLIVPYGIARDVLAVAGGADLDDSGSPIRDLAGRPTRGTLAGGDGVAIGPGIFSLIDETILAWSRYVVTAAAKRRPGAFLSPELKTDLELAATIAAQPGKPHQIPRQLVHTWELNVNGTAQENLPEHKKLAGTRVVEESELAGVPGVKSDSTAWPYTGSRYPGDHKHCHCGWVPSYEMIRVTGGSDAPPPSAGNDYDAILSDFYETGEFPHTPALDDRYWDRDIAQGELEDEWLKRVVETTIDVGDDTRGAVRHYAGMGHRSINRRLRENDMTPEVDEFVGAINKGMTPTQERTTVVRWISSEQLEDVGEGSSMRDDGFMSTTRQFDPDNFEDFGDAAIVIEVPKGTPHIVVDALFKGPVDLLDSEFEILFPPGSTLEILGEYNVGMLEEEGIWPSAQRVLRAIIRTP